MIRQYLEKILKGYQKAKKENFDGHPMVKLINNDFPNYLNQITPNADKYKFMSNAGKKTADTSWTCCPTNAILNSDVTKTIGKGYFVIYIFSQDTKRAYLSLNQGIQTFSSDEIQENSSKLREKLGEIPNKFNLESIELGDPAFFGRYQIANICARCYNLDNLPSEEELQSDYLEMLKLYDKISPQSEYLKIIENPKEIKEAQEKFLEILYKNADEIITTDKIRIGRSGEFEAEAYWSNSLGFWTINRELEGNRYFNAFGIEKPDESIVNAICEINFEKERLSRRTSGAFAKDLEGNLYIIHRGSFAGKKKEEFFNKYHGKTAQIEDGDAEIQAVVIGSLNDPKLPEYVRNFVFEVGRFKGLISESTNSISIYPKKWVFSVNKNNFHKLKDEITWNSALEVKKDDIILFYRGEPERSINDIFMAKTDPYEDSAEVKGGKSIKLQRKFTIKNPLSWEILKHNPILKEWAGVKMRFGRSHFKTSEKEWNEIKRLILDKNPELKNDLEILEINHSNYEDFTIGMGRAHIVRDICYLIKENPNISENALFDLLRKKVGTNEDYWRAYYQRANKSNSPLLNLDSAKNLKLVNSNRLELTNQGRELVNNVTSDELYTHYYSLKTKKFYFKLALENLAIKTAMQILREQRKLRFYSPTCDLTNKVVWNYEHGNEFICKEEKHPECKDCDKDLLSHIKETSLPFEADKKIKEHGEYVFWMCSRVTPMHLTGSDPVYSGNYIYWDDNAEKELGDLDEFNFKKFFETIFKEYPVAKKNKQKVKGHKLSKIFGKYSKYIEKIAEPYIPNDKHIFKARSYFTAAGGWNNKPFTYLEDKYLEGKVESNESYYILTLFSDDTKTVALTLNTNWNNFGNISKDTVSQWSDEEKRAALRNRSSEIREKIEKISEIPSEFKGDFSNAPWEPTIILGKVYSAESLPSEIEIEKDFIEILKIYNKFIELEYGEKESINLIRTLFEEFNENYFTKTPGVKHGSGYEKERQEVYKYYNKIKSDPEIFKDVNKPIINYLLPIKRFSVAPAGFNDIKAVRRGEENLPEFSKSVFNLITNLINTDDVNNQKELIHSFKSGDGKGIQSAVLSSVLYFLNPKYLYINNKTVKTYNLLSEILGYNDHINSNLTDYIDNLEKLKRLLEKIYELVPEFKSFEVFDSFCHWMCDSELGAYAVNSIKLEILKNYDLNLRNSFEIIINNYRKAKDDKISPNEKVLIRELLATTLPERLSEVIQGKYKSFSSAWDKWHYCPYVALMNEKITTKHITGYYVNYIFREDMSGVYLVLRQGVPEFDKRKLAKKSEEYRSKIRSLKEVTEFSEEIDLKSSHSKYGEYYEAANIYSKFYPAENIPSEEELISDLEKMLKLYDDLSELTTIQYNSFNDYLKDKNFLYTPEMLENYLLSLKVKPFVILTGNSGTGKTKIAQLFAEYLEQKDAGKSVIIPVGANWTENRHLMGFFNVITSDYQSTPALDLIIKASNDNSKPYFLILDEMNLSHVERYFSDFLSAIESGKEISLYSEDNAKIIKNKLIPEKLEIPDNLFVIGTVNVDETTYMFSPKVLDRANTIEFKTYPARDFIMCEIEHESPEGNIDYLENPLSHLKIRNCKINKLKDQLTHVKFNDDNNLWEELASEIHSFQEVLAEASFDFGFRVIDEIMRFMYLAWLYEDSPDEWNNWQRYFDAQIMQKMLPKIHGSQQELSQVLENLFERCYGGESVDKIWYSANLEEYEIKYHSSAKKLQKMGKKLHEKRFVSFTD